MPAAMPHPYGFLSNSQYTHIHTLLPSPLLDLTTHCPVVGVSSPSCV